MEKSPKRLDRRTFWMWVVLLVLGHVLANVSIPAPGSAALLPMIGIDDVILILLSIALARRFRDIGWPVWIGPTILLVTIGLPFLGIGIAMMNHAGDQIMQWLPLYGLISGPLNLVLLIVAGFVPGKPASIEVARFRLRCAECPRTDNWLS